MICMANIVHQAKKITVANYAIWYNVPFMISHCPFFLALQIFLIYPQIQILQCSLFLFIYKDDAFFVVCWMGTTHSTKIVKRPSHGAMAVRTEVLTTENRNPLRCPISMDMVTYNS